MHPTVLRKLQELKISYKIIKHSDLSDVVKSPSDFAALMDIDVKSVAKTLVVTNKKTKELTGIVCPANYRVDFQKVATHFGWSKRVLAVPDELFVEKTLGFSKFGIGPIGIDIPLLVDNILLNSKIIYIGAGEPGVEIEVNSLLLKESLGLIAGDFVKK